jgi:hypothetical protein
MSQECPSGRKRRPLAHVQVTAAVYGEFMCCCSVLYGARCHGTIAGSVLMSLVALFCGECCGMGVAAGWCHMSFKGPMVLNSCRTICCAVCMLVLLLNDVVILF